MASNISLIVPDGWQPKAAAEIQTFGGTLTGDAIRGEFSVPVPALGLVAGNYSGTAGKLDIVITKKPFVLPCAVIEAYVRRRFGGG